MLKTYRMKTEYHSKINILVSAAVIIVSVLAGCSKKEKVVFNEPSDINGHKIGLMVGTTHVDYIAEDFPDAEQCPYDNVTDMIHALKVRKVDAMAIEGLLWKSIQHEHEDLMIIWDDWKLEPFGMIFNKSNTQLLEQYNTFLRELKESGELKAINEKWINGEEQARMPDLSGVPRSGEPLKVGCTGTMAVYDFIRDGKNTGLDMEIVELFAAYLGRPVEYQMMNFGGLISAISSNVVDMATSSMCITGERSKQVNFGESYSDGISVIVIRKENGPQGAHTDGYRSLDDLSTSVVGTLLGSTQDLWIKDNYPKAKRLVFNNRADLVNALRSHQCKAIILDEGSKDVLDENKDFAILQKDFCPVDMAVCFPLGSSLLPEYNEFQSKLKKSGELDAIFEKWSDTTGKDKRAPVEIVEFPGEPLVLGTTLIQAPYSFLVNNEPAGFDIEIMALFAKSIGRTLKIVPYDFGGLIPALTNGMIDVAANSIMYTPERGEVVAFADPYLQQNSYAVTFADALAADHPNYKEVERQKKGLLDTIAEKFHDNLLKESRWKLIVDGLRDTILITIFSVLLGALLGVGVCVLRMSRNVVCRGFAKWFIDIIRGIPVLVLLMILFYVVFARLGISAVTVAIISFALNFAANSSEMYRSGLESIDPGQKKAGIAMGFTNMQTFLYITLPQTVKRVLPVFKGEAINLLKTTSIVGYIAVVDLTKASDIIRSRTFDAFFPLIIITIIYFILAWLLGKALDLISSSSKSEK